MNSVSDKLGVYQNSKTERNSRYTSPYMSHICPLYVPYLAFIKTLKQRGTAVTHHTHVSVWLCVAGYNNLHAHTHIHTHARAHTHTYTHTHIHTHSGVFSVHVCICLCVGVWLCVCVCVCMCVCHTTSALGLSACSKLEKIKTVTNSTYRTVQKLVGIGNAGYR